MRLANWGRGADLRAARHALGVILPMKRIPPVATFHSGSAAACEAAGPNWPI
jgi:hypothetical protein